ncbi:hypothetical protein [uncultured Gammaproteobacteria bacterium]|nr:hypothetical protein [uncultured Gammaproteobacteria bacterium]
MFFVVGNKTYFRHKFDYSKIAQRGPFGFSNCGQLLIYENAMG